MSVVSLQWCKASSHARTEYVVGGAHSCCLVLGIQCVSPRLTVHLAIIHAAHTASPTVLSVQVAMASVMS